MIRVEPSALQPTIRLLAGKKTSGEPVFEEVPVEELTPPGEYRLLASPGLVLGVACGDVVRVDSTTGEFDVLLRGGNLCIQLYGPPPVGDSVAQAIESLGGWRDGRASKLTVFTLPAVRGFSEVENVLNSVAEENSGVEWFYGNVYEKDGVTPLNWWK
ncbi:DUF4265 domain-containing protein [Streptomyces sp. 130]|uniref:DUF4265 domain-containing protein n=1 Tax=Streptomyces sp. 130 TaxID=2591006 RepID=UPI00117F6257|nr:DUF4265 domain-containing protein [Streptomyces sp. 130]TRV79529.1 DUF4265 domain-containing protein [Streptomyces sp. 130]